MTVFMLWGGSDTGFLLTHCVSTCPTAPWKTALSNGSVLFRGQVCGRAPCRAQWSGCVFSPPSRSPAPELVGKLNGRALVWYIGGLGSIPSMENQKQRGGPGEVVPSVPCLLNKHEDLGQSPEPM